MVSKKGEEIRKLDERLIDFCLGFKSTTFEDVDRRCTIQFRRILKSRKRVSFPFFFLQVELIQRE